MKESLKLKELCMNSADIVNFKYDLSAMNLYIKIVVKLFIIII